MNSSPIRAITLDLDDTLWPIWPVIERAEQALHEWLLRHCPRTAERFPIVEMRALRASVADAHPHLTHDYCAQRTLSLQQAMRASGEDPAGASEAFEVFMAERNRVDLYPDALDGLHRLGAQHRLAALTNGNADLQRIGLATHFEFALGAREFGRAKPDPSIFLAACARLDLAPHEVLHVGDDPELDVLGARAAGLHCAWINRRDEQWTHECAPDITITSLLQLADWLDSRPTAKSPT
ncbi:MAG: HAD-IA family hydrolase [Aquimonas sp.]|jgi:putative hydrolase of the HAD superfamily|nr:HAD-IA family hydrolase [Xanthomonadales bacterium]MCC6505775.1 HAD-IA family hydrolase [Aquimonas sp.]